MMFTSVWSLLACTLALGPFPDRVGWHTVNGVRMQASATLEWSELLRLRWEDGSLAADVFTSERAKAVTRAGRAAAVELGRAKDLYEVRALSEGQLGAGPGAGRLVLSARLLPEAGHADATLRPQNVIAGAGMLRVTGRGRVRGGQDVFVVFICDQATGVQLTVSEAAKPQSPLNLALRGQSLRELRDKDPQAVRRFLAPLLRHISGDDLLAAGPGDVYLVFDAIEPDESVRQALQGILPRMLAPLPAERERAMDELRRLGAPGVCAAARLDLPALAPQQQVMIEQWLRDNCRRLVFPPQPGELIALRRDRQFLADCLDSGDVKVRAAAIQQLKLQIQPEDVDACAKKADELRAGP